MTEGSTGSARAIVGRHSFSVGSSLVWRTTGSNIMRVAQPLGSRGGGRRPQAGYPGRRWRCLHRGALAASTAVRAVIGAVSVVGWVVGPALAGWTVFSELRKIRRARRDLNALLSQQYRELAAFRARSRRLEAQYVEFLQTPADEREMVTAR